MSYETPRIDDKGDLLELTLGCLGSGPPDAVQPAPAGYPDNSPAFGNPAFCA